MVQINGANVKVSYSNIWVDHFMPKEIDFNDAIRTTLQALYAIYDNCNSLHTNAYDEAITTPTEDSVKEQWQYN